MSKYQCIIFGEKASMVLKKMYQISNLQRLPGVNERRRLDIVFQVAQHFFIFHQLTGQLMGDKSDKWNIVKFMLLHGLCT